MKYSVGQKVKIRSLEWYRDNVNRYGIIEPISYFENKAESFYEWVKKNIEI